MAATLTCESCGATTLRRGGNQRYCVPCSNRLQRERQTEWARRHAPDVVSGRARRAGHKSLRVRVGEVLSEQNRGHMAWSPLDMVDLPRKLRVAVPFNWAWSKNAVWRTGRGGHVYARRESNAVRDALAARIRNAGERFYQGKLYVDIFVEKPNHRGDAINVVDVVCDAVKDATGVDDRWYSILGLDWSIVKSEPRIIVGIGQLVDEDHRCCAHCGRVFPSREITRRTCRDCSAPIRTAKNLGVDSGR